MPLSSARRGYLKAALETYLSAPAPKPLRILYRSPGCVWPFPSDSGSTSVSSSLNIAVLDSSFNPPTLAHLGLALSSPAEREDNRHYDAHMLLLSVRNADKGIANNAGHRLEMMELLAYDMEDRIKAHSSPCVALAIVDEPLIAAKSTLVLDWLRSDANIQRLQSSLPSPSVLPRLHWLVGSDTLPRFLNPKYYSAGQDGLMSICHQLFRNEGTRMVCARRASVQLDSETARAEEKALLASEPCSTFVQEGSIVVRDLLHERMAHISSTEIRDIITKNEDDQAAVLAKLEDFVTPSIASHLVSENIYVVQEGATMKQ